MADQARSFVVPLACLAAAVGLAAAVHRPHPSVAQLGPRAVGDISPAERRATFTFDGTVAPSDRAAFFTALSHARPEARRLIDLIDGVTTIRIGKSGPDALGTTQEIGRRWYVTLDFDDTAPRYGQPGIDRVVLHELGHVVDEALVPDALKQQLDAQIPQGYGCTDGVTGACAPPNERFAESFAKWATGNIGLTIDAGYFVPPPDDLERWGAELASIGR